MNMHGWITSDDLLGIFFPAYGWREKLGKWWWCVLEKRKKNRKLGTEAELCFYVDGSSEVSTGSFGASVAEAWMWWIVYNHEFWVNEIGRNIQTWHKHYHLGCDVSSSSQLHSSCDFARFHWIRSKSCAFVTLRQRSAFYRSAIILYQWLVSRARGWIRGPCLNKKQSRAPNFSNFILLIHDIVIFTTLTAFLYTRHHRQSFGSIESLVYVSEKSFQIPDNHWSSKSPYSSIPISKYTHRPLLSNNFRL